MARIYHVAVLVGSLRKGSYTRKLALALAGLAPENLKLAIVEIGDLPLYNADLEAAAPQTWTQFRQQVKAADAVLFATPEYNRSLPAALKNALDVGSLPHGANAWDKKPGAVISLSTGAIGGFGANHHLRQSLVYLNVLPLQQPEAYIGAAATLFNEAGAITHEATAKFLTGYMQAFAAWIEQNLREV